MSEITKYLKDRADRAVQEQKEKERMEAELRDANEALNIIGRGVDDDEG